MEHTKQHSLPVELMWVKGNEQAGVFFYNEGNEIKSCYIETRGDYDDGSYYNMTVDVYGLLDYIPLMRLRNLLTKETYLSGFEHIYIEMVMHLTDRDSERSALYKSNDQISTSIRLIESDCDDQENKAFKERGYKMLMTDQANYKNSVKQAVKELRERRAYFDEQMEHLRNCMGDVDRQLALLEDTLEA